MRDDKTQLPSRREIYERQRRNLRDSWEMGDNVAARVMLNNLVRLGWLEAVSDESDDDRKI